MPFQGQEEKSSKKMQIKKSCLDLVVNVQFDIGIWIVVKVVVDLGRFIFKRIHFKLIERWERHIQKKII